MGQSRDAKKVICDSDTEPLQRHFGSKTNTDVENFPVVISNGKTHADSNSAIPDKFLNFSFTIATLDQPITKSSKKSKNCGTVSPFWRENIKLSSLGVNRVSTHNW